MSMTRPLVTRAASGLTHSVLLIAVAVSGVLAVLAVGRAAVADGATLAVTLADPVRSAALPGLPEGASIDLGDAPVDLSVAVLPPALRLFVAAGPALLLLSLAGGAWCLAGLVRSARAGRPFERRNPARLAGVAAAVLVGGLLAPLVSDLAGLAALDSLGLLGQGSPFAMAATVSVAPAVLAAVVLTVAEAFRRGAALSDDVEGLV